MQPVLVIGASGFVGGGIARRLARTGYKVTGLTRTSDGAAKLQAAGVEPTLADLGDGLAEVLRMARQSSAVVFAAQLAPEHEVRVISSLLDALTGSGARLLFTSGTGVLLQRTGGAWSEDSFAEHDVFAPEPLALLRMEAERLVQSATAGGVDGIVIRPPLIWGPGDHGHVAMTYRSVAATGAACYVGEGLAAYSNVHLDDVARLYSLALERGVPGAVYHGVGGEVPNRWIAEAVARDLACETRSVSPEEAQTIWGEFGALIMSSCSRSRSPRSRRELGWRPEHTGMLGMIGEPRLRALAQARPAA